MSQIIRSRISKRQAMEMIKQFEQNPNFVIFKSSDGESYTITIKKGGILIHINKFDKKYYLEFFA